MRVTRITTSDELEPLAEAWDALASGAAFRRWQWLATWWRHYGASHALFTLCVHDGQRLIGIAPWYLRTSRLQSRVVQFLGTGEVCSDYLGLLCEPDREAEVAAALADWLVEHRDSDRWDLLHLSGVEADDIAIGHLTERLAAHGCTAHRACGANCWRLSLPADWQTYVASLSKSHRKQVRRLEDRYLASGRAVLHTITSHDELPRGRQILFDLHQRRRQSLGEAGCFASRAFTAFHAEAMEQLLATQSLRLHWLELDGCPVAAEYHLVGGRVIYGYQSGVDPERLDDEPGRLAAIVTLKLAIEEGYQAFDFLRGDEPYKAHWRAEPRAMLDWRIVPKRLTARLKHTVWLARERVKQMVRGNSASQATRLNDN